MLCLLDGLRIASVQSFLIGIQIQFVHYKHFPKRVRSEGNDFQQVHFYALRLFRINEIWFFIETDCLEIIPNSPLNTCLFLKANYFMP